MQRVAVVWLVLKLTNSLFDIGLVTAFKTFPVLGLALFSNVFTVTANSRLQMLTPAHLRGRLNDSASGQAL